MFAFYPTQSNPIYFVTDASLITAAYKQGDSGGKGGGSRVGCVAAVEELCAAIGVPLPQEVVNSTSAMTMVRCWGKQFAGAFGPAQKGAGVCGIGGEVSSRSHFLGGLCEAYGCLWGVCVDKEAL